MRPRAKVTIEEVPVVYEKSIGTKMNDFDLCLEVVSTQTIKVTATVALHLTLTSRKPLEIEAWFQRTTDRKWHMGYRMVT